VAVVVSDDVRAAWYTSVMRGLVAVVLVLIACRGSSPSVEPTPHAAEPRRPEPAVRTGGFETAPQCPAIASRLDAEAAYQDGLAQLEASRDGDHFIIEPFEGAMARMREAAAAGHARAQAVMGSTKFGVMFLKADPQPGQREAYIDAMMWLRTSALVGEPDALGFMPGLDGDSPPLDEMPLSDVPAEWVHEAWRRADAWIACYGLPWTSP
jgi:hypothetical protein